MSFCFIFFIPIIISSHILVTRLKLASKLEKLKDGQRDIENVLSNIRLRWHSLREEKVKATAILENVKRLAELGRLTEEKTRADLDEKVSNYLIRGWILNF